MADLIDRQAAIDCIILLLEQKEEDDHDKTWNNAIRGAVNSVAHHTPSAQPEQHWIPCSERLPEENGEYLVLYYTHSKYKPYVYDVISFANDLYQIDEYYFPDKKGQKGWFYCDGDYGYCEDNSVLAWMPLPEPYREEK